EGWRHAAARVVSHLIERLQSETRAPRAFASATASGDPRDQPRNQRRPPRQRAELDVLVPAVRASPIAPRPSSVGTPSAAVKLPPEPPPVPPSRRSCPISLATPRASS